VKRIPADDGAKKVLTLTARDLNEIREGGEFALRQGEDFDGTVGQAKAALEKWLIAEYGRFSLSEDKKNGVVRVKLTPPTQK
jgi:hypothetical protein